MDPPAVAVELAKALVPALAAPPNNEDTDPALNNFDETKPPMPPVLPVDKPSDFAIWPARS